MELLQIIYFCDAAQSENFSKTAQKYRVPPSNISQSIHRLENELETTLFDRSSNKIFLNERGKNFYIRAKKALSLLEEAKNIVFEEEDIIKGEIKICICTNRRIVTQAIENFRKNYPFVSFVIYHDIPSEHHEFDMVIADDSFNGSNMKKELLIKENIVLAIPKSNPLSNISEITASDLKNQRFITMHERSSLFRHTNLICNSMHFVPDISIRTDDPFYIRKYVELGLGIAFIPEVSWQGMFSDNIVFKSVGHHKRNTYVYIKNDKYMSRAVKEFIGELTKECAEQKKSS